MRGRGAATGALLLLGLSGLLAVVSELPGPAATAHSSGHASPAHRAIAATTTTTTISPTAATPPYPVWTDSVTFNDPSRTTPARGSVPAKTGRLLVTDLYIPVGAPSPLPLVVFAHGWNSDPGKYDVLLQQWAQAGFLVAAPVFPDSTDLYAGSPVSDYADQARDLSFVITSLLQSGALDIDPQRIAVAGHSDGGTDIALLALDPAYADSRIRAYLSLSGEIPTGVDPFTPVPTPGSLLVAVGTDDEYGLYPLSPKVFQAAVMPKVMLTEEGGDHLGSFIGATPAAAAMRAATVEFLDRALAPGPQSSDELLAALEPTGSSLVAADA